MKLSPETVKAYVRRLNEVSKRKYSLDRYYDKWWSLTCDNEILVDGNLRLVFEAVRGIREYVRLEGENANIQR